MITLTAEIRVQGENPSPFRLGVSRLGENLLGASIDNTEVIDKRNILSLETEIRDRADIDKPSFGLISNGGQISFSDNNSKFLKYVENGILKNGERIAFFLSNTVSKTTEQVGEYFVTSFDYDKDNKTVSVHFDDDLIYTQEEVVQSKPYISEETAENLIIYANSNSSTLSYEESEETKEKLSKTTIKYPTLKDMSVWSLTNSICCICGFSGYKNKKGKMTFSKSL